MNRRARRADASLARKGLTRAPITGQSTPAPMPTISASGKGPIRIYGVDLHGAIGSTIVLDGKTYRVVP